MLLLPRCVSVPLLLFFRPVVVNIGRAGMATDNVTQRVIMLKENEKPHRSGAVGAAIKSTTPYSKPWHMSRLSSVFLEPGCMFAEF